MGKNAGTNASTGGSDPGTSRRRLALTATSGGFLLAVSIAGGGLLVLRAHAAEPPDPVPPPFTMSTAPVPAAVTTAAGAVTSEDPSERREVLTLPAQKALAAHGNPRLFPEGTAVVLDAPSWRQNGNLGSVNATVHSPGAADSRLLFVFMRTEGRWRLSSTEQP